MTYQEIEQVAEIAALRPQIEAAGLDYSASVEKAVDTAYNTKRVADTAKTEIISFVVDFLVKLIDEKMGTPAKTKAGFVTRFLWGIARILGIKKKAVEAANKL
jgi:hypothetical protein